ncbi:integration host factor subunit alpha [Methylocapsa sp. S129]|uniref:integration host factor subunit alpha n=1 Tax=Methylocapsa sp. S129 TaxID=1641869 RepID=UPI00131AB294|nr:integration host factor subunit alpha [Methylocapsa sp. S129]
MESKLVSPRARAVTRDDLASAVYGRVGASRAEAHALVDMMLAEIVDTLSRGENVKLSSFGAFFVRSKSERIGRNPKTGVEAPIAARRVVVFKASKILGGRLNGPVLVDEPLGI